MPPDGFACVRFCWRKVVGRFQKLVKFWQDPPLDINPAY